MDHVRDVDAQRNRWATYRQRQGLVEDAGDGFAAGGLGDQMENLDVRLLILPSDPLADVVPLDKEALDWLEQQRDSPFEGSQMEWGHRSRASSTALVVYNQYDENKGWDRYLALHRHGGVEFASSRLAYQLREMRIFALRNIVGFSWSVLAIQAAAIKRWAIQHPFELTVALSNTRGATLGDFAEGWAQPGQGLFEFSKCTEENILLRWEIDEEFDASEIALDLGDRIEQAFGTTHRRHFARTGPYDGKFDPRF
jgi:hypothetical protein